jgi:hypothetical protein
MTPVLRIRDVNPGSVYFLSWITIQQQKKAGENNHWYYIFVAIKTSDPDPGVKKHRILDPDLQH